MLEVREEERDVRLQVQGPLESRRDLGERIRAATLAVARESRGSVRRELRWFSSLLPLMYSDWSRPWAPGVYCTDSSERGFGVMKREIDPVLVGAWGRQSEKWRFEHEDAPLQQQV